MATISLARKQQQALRGYEGKYRQLQAEIEEVGYVLKGSVTKRFKECGKQTCRCHDDPDARHGPYYQWSWKSRGRTVSVYLDEEQAAMCKRWIKNNRRLEKLMGRLRSLSLRVARLYGVAPR